MVGLGKQIWDGAKNGNNKEVSRLLNGGVERSVLSYEEKNPDVYNWPMTALGVASCRGDVEMVNKLANAGADVNQQDSEHAHTALMCASDKGQTAAVQALLQLDAKVNMTNKFGWTALMKASNMGRLDIVRLLLDWGADKTLQDYRGETASQKAQNAEIRSTIDNHVYKGTKFGGRASAPAATSTSTSTAKKTGSPAEVAAAECAALEGECDTLGEHVAQAPARRDLMQRRDVLLSQFNAARAIKPVDYAHLSTLGESLEALKQESAKVTLSEEDYLTLAARHVALVKKVKAKCDALLKSQQPVLLVSLAAKLTMLQGFAVDTLGPSTTGAKSVAEAAAKPHDAAKLQRLQTECTTFNQQLAHAPVRKDLMQRRDELAARLSSVTSASSVDYALAGKLMLEQQALEQESGKLPLSEKDYKTMGSRHAALVQQVQGMCEELVAARQYRLLRDLAAQLTALRALDLSVLQDPSETDPVWVDEAAADPVHVARAPESTDKSPAPTRSIPMDGQRETTGDKAKESKKEKCVVQ